MSNYNSTNTHVLATHEQHDGNTRMLLLHVCESGRHEYVVGSYFTVKQVGHMSFMECHACGNYEPVMENREEYEWTWGHYFQSVVDAVDYWQHEVAADLLEGFEVKGTDVRSLPLATVTDAYDTRYVIVNEYTGEVFRNLDRYDVGELLEEWLAEDGYECADGEHWQSYRWADYAPGYVVRVSDGE